VSATNTSVLFIVGPTAVGKTSLAVSLARRFGGEIINADSRQVYRYMDIGTAKPAPEEQSQVPHHLLDLLDPNQDFGLGSFLSLARGIIREIHDRGGLPIVAGGTGQYIWALLEGWQVPKVPPDPEFRKAKEIEAEQYGAMALHQKLQQVDPQRAAQLDPRNVRRVIRALEIYQSGQRGLSGSPRQAGPMADVLVIGLNLDRRDLYRRIDDRIDRMLDAGLVEEVRSIAALGYPTGIGPLSSPGYRELGQFLSGEIALDEAVQRTKYQTHRLARRQNTWFKRNDSRIRWLEADSPDLEERAAGLVESFLSGAPAVIK